MIKPNLVKLLKSVGQEKPVLEVVQRSKKDLEENLKEGENKLTGKCKYTNIIFVRVCWVLTFYLDAKSYC